MNNNLYQTIEELKNTLENIDSARKQVSDTVAAYSATQSGIQDYVDKLCGIESALKQLVALLQNNKVIIEQQASSAIANLQTTCTEITAKISEEQEATALSFSERLNSKIQEIDRQVSTFDNSVKRVESLAKNIKEISDNVANVVQTVKVIRQELSFSQNEQDVVLGRIDGNVSSLMSSCSESAKVLNDEINSKAKILRNVLGQLKDSNENIIQKLAVDDEEVEDTLEKLKDDIKNELTITLKKEIVEQKMRFPNPRQRLKNEQKQIGILALLLLLYSCF